jgi:hypothetical protein
MDFDINEPTKCLDLYVTYLYYNMRASVFREQKQIKISS